MNHIASILARLHDPPRVRTRKGGVPAWQRAAHAAWTIARERAGEPATLAQLQRICQLLSTAEVRDHERRRAYLRIIGGCSRAQASAMLDYLIPTVRGRRAEEARPEHACGQSRGRSP